MSTPAERQRRSRAHRAGNHLLCDPARCPAFATVTTTVDAPPVTPAVTPVTPAASPDPVTPPVTAAAAPAEPPRFGPRGRRLWAQLNDGRRNPAEVVLIEETCRIADRLDLLDAVLAGDQITWMELRAGADDDAPMVIVIDNALSQARMHATTLRGLVTELRQSNATGTAGAHADKAGDPLDEIARRRAARLATAAGS